MQICWKAVTCVMASACRPGLPGIPQTSRLVGCVVLGASKHGKGPSLKACSSFSGSSFCILVSWLWSANPKSSVWEAVGAAQALEPTGAEGLSTYVHVSISGEDLTSCVYLVSATESREQGTNMSDNVFHIEIIKENCCWREMCL